LVASERSSLFEAFWQEFGAGVYVSNTALDQHLTWHAMIGHRPEIAVPNSGDQFGDGDYAHTARVTLLPVWEQDGRYLLHLGASAQYRSATQDRDTGLPGTPVASPILPGTPGQRIPRDSSGNVVRFRDRPELRAAAGGLGNNGRFVDTGNIIADGVWTTAGELLAYWGPLHFQAEATWARTINAIYPTAPQPGTAPAFTTSGLPRGNLNYWGVYGQAGYFLTGENRGYDRRLGRYAGVKPNENFFCVKGEDDGVHSGSGAWELIYRYSFIDLNDKNVNGGLLGEHTVGVNWYLNPNFKIQLNALAINRDVKNSLGGFNVPANAGIANVNVPNPTLTPVSGTIYGLGLRFHLDF
jgi:phosphate-selective porin OprO/OprP